MGERNLLPHIKVVYTDPNSKKEHLCIVGSNENRKYYGGQRFSKHGSHNHPITKSYSQTDRTEGSDADSERVVSNDRTPAEFPRTECINQTVQLAQGSTSTSVRLKPMNKEESRGTSDRRISRNIGEGRMIAIAYAKCEVPECASVEGHRVRNMPREWKTITSCEREFLLGRSPIPETISKCCKTCYIDISKKIDLFINGKFTKEFKNRVRRQHTEGSGRFAS